MKRPDFIETNPFSDQALTDLMNLALTLKAAARADSFPPLCEKQVLALAGSGFEPRIRMLFFTAMYQLGGMAQTVACGTAPEQAKETASLLAGGADAVVVSDISHEFLLLLAKHADMPVLNAGSDFCLPLAELSCLISMYEHLPKEKRLESCKLVYHGPHSPLCASALLLCTKMGIPFCQLSGKQGELPPPILKMGERNVKKSGGTYAVTDDTAEALKGADFLLGRREGLTVPAGSEARWLDPSENLLAAIRAALVWTLYQDPASRDALLIEKLRRTLAVKLQAVFEDGTTKRS